MVKMDIGPLLLLLYKYCLLCQYESTNTNINQKQPLKETFQFGIFWDWNVRRSVNSIGWDPITFLRASPHKISGIPSH